MPPLSNPERRALKASAQRLKPLLRVGRQGLTPAFIAALDQALAARELVKVKFDEFKEAKEPLSAQMAGETASEIVMRVGHVLVLFRKRPAPAAPAVAPVPKPAPPPPTASPSPSRRSGRTAP